MAATFRQLASFVPWTSQGSARTADRTSKSARPATARELTHGRAVEVAHRRGGVGARERERARAEPSAKARVEIYAHVGLRLRFRFRGALGAAASFARAALLRDTRTGNGAEVCE